MDDDRKYACVSFKKDDGKLYKEWLSAMVGAEIIVLSKEQINAEYDSFISAHQPTDARVVLHNETEVKSFILTMNTFFKGLEYELTDTPNDEQFERWLSSKMKDTDIIYPPVSSEIQ